MAAESVSTPAGIYVHVPFCLKKCRYCDFFSVTDPARKDDFVSALIREMARVRRPASTADTLYFGGGTPSLLAPAAVARIIDAAAGRFGLVPDSEITLEANPGTVTLERLAAYRAAGVNRLNLGLQTLDPRGLRLLGRIHDAAQGTAAVRMARKAGFANLGLDLIYGLPGQRVDDWQRDLARATALSPEHLSCYMLTIEPDTPLARDCREGRIQPLADHRVRRLFETTVHTLAGAGYGFYEVSNFARSPALRSRHNTKYWHGAPYAGLGPAAHSFFPWTRSWNVADLDAYFAAVAAGGLPVAETEHLTREQQMIESVYLGLRQADGIDVHDFERRFDVVFDEMFGPVLKDLAGREMIRPAPGRCALSLAGMLYLDSITGRMVDVIR
jgi:putative oxygen-independent coproporphyrinogen III oxidase